MSRLGPKEIPKTIYHYCSLETFNSIITSKTLRLSDITKSNDSKELIYIRPFIKEEFLNVYRSEPAQFFKNAVGEGQWQKITEHYINDWFDENYRYYSFYVMCFSNRPDVLSQWRGYANDGNGVSIGLDREVLKRLLGACVPHPELDKVEYIERTQKARVKKIATDTIKAIKNEFNPEHLKNIEVNPADDSWLMKFFNSAFDKLFNLAVICKNPFFSEESEYRIWYRVDKKTVSSELNDDLIIDGGDASGIDIKPLAYFMPFHFGTKENSIYSYVDLCFEGAIDQKMPLIKEVWTGPKCKASKREVEMLLAQHGFPLDENGSIGARADQSKGSYR